MRILKFVLLFIIIIVVSSYTLLPKIKVPTSILILGKGGEGHTAPDLTDTIMVSYLNTELNKTSILSLPRDIWISEIRAKLNTAYHYGGFKMVGDSVKHITNIPVNYTIVVDFSLFKDLIDSMGGINIKVDNSFIDNKYPIEGKEEDLCEGDKLYKCRYETLDIKSGIQNMDGTLALKFVRSRNATGNEGTDLAREKRQQKVLEAIREKVLSKEILSFKKLKSLYNVFVTHINTDIDKKTAISFAKFLFENKGQINFLTIPDDLLKVSQDNKKYDKQYVFLPKSGTWKEVQDWITNQVQLPIIPPKDLQQLK